MGANYGPLVQKPKTIEACNAIPDRFSVCDDFRGPARLAEGSLGVGNPNGLRCHRSATQICSLDYSAAMQ